MVTGWTISGLWCAGWRAYSICVSNAGGTGLRVLYESKDPCRSPNWSPRLSSSRVLEAQPGVSTLLTR